MVSQKVSTLETGRLRIALALKLSADLVLLDERDGRNAAKLAGLRVTGVHWRFVTGEKRWTTGKDTARTSGFAYAIAVLCLGTLTRRGVEGRRRVALTALTAG
jgi:hypothetical protein